LVEQGASSLFIDLIDNLNGDKSGKEIANFIINILLGAKNERGLEIEDLKHRISTKMLVELLQSLNQKTIYYHQAKKIVEFWLNQTKDGLFSISETLQQNPTLAGNVSEPVLEEEIRLVLEQNPKLLKDLQEKPQALNFLCGKVMRKVNGRADPLLLQSVARRVCENDRGPLPT
jgi:Asp-tRNA(Asn)/Glu-tRNA(Gln) amidotransferase B subunit